MKYILDPRVPIGVGIVFFALSLTDLMMRHGSSIGDMSKLGHIYLVIFCICLVWAMLIPFISRRQ